MNFLSDVERTMIIVISCKKNEFFLQNTFDSGERFFLSNVQKNQRNRLENNRQRLFVQLLQALKEQVDEYDLE